MPKTAEDYRKIANAQSEHHAICAEVFRETDAQLTKWGVQDHPMGTGPAVHHPLLTNHVYNRVGMAESMTNRTDRSAENGTLTYEHILTEEFAEAMAEDGPSEALETELIQVAAVAVSMVAASRRARGA